MTSKRTTTDPIPLPASPEGLPTAQSGAGQGAASGRTGIPHSQEAGVAANAADSADRATRAGARPAASADAGSGTWATDTAVNGPASDRKPSAGGHDRPPHQDSALESFGKAITAPIAGAAEDEEPGPGGVPRVKPGD